MLRAWSSLFASYSPESIREMASIFAEGETHDESTSGVIQSVVSSTPDY
jgi:hypothetical protein